MDFFESHKAKLIQHYDKLFKYPAWMEYVRQRTKMIGQDNPELYGEIAARYNTPTKSSAGRRKIGA